MFNATLKHILITLVIVTMAGLAGCTSPEEKRAQQLEEAQNLSDQGAYEEALDLLEELAALYPNDPDILESMGRIYAMQEDHTMAAFFLEQASLQKPDDVELLYATYQSMIAGGLSGGATLEKLATLSPEAMTNELWKALGAHRAENNQTEAALEAYLKGVNPEQPNPETAVAIGQLFADLKNNAQAAKWFETAADRDDPSARPALFGMLEIQLEEKKWIEAEKTIAQLEAQFPGAVDESEWKQASDELKRWRIAQEEMKAKLAAAEAAKKKAEEEAARKKAEEEAARKKAEEEAAAAETSTVLAADELEAGEGKTAVVAELEAAEALANKPAEEGPVIAFNPNVSIEPADPADFGITVNFDQEGTAPETTVSAESDAVGTNFPEPADPLDGVEEVTPIPEVSVPDEPKTMEDLLAEAEAAEMNRDYKSAIRKYWAAISIANNRAEVWNLLSRAYLADGQLENSDTAALEAVRLAPREVAYTLDFLRVAQRSRPPKEFLGQLETAYDRFPASPEITLSLARAHERISKENLVARNLYLRFVDIAPNHPLVPEAQAAADRLR